MKLYSMVSYDCSGKVNWLLHELGVDFENVKLSWKEGDLNKPEYLALSPLGQVPALESEDVSMFDSYAIVSYLADKYIEKGLAPKFEDSASRAEYYQWLWFASNSAGDFFGRYFKLGKMKDDFVEQWGDYTKEKVQMILKTIEDRLVDREYILGDFSAVDICLCDSLITISEESFFSDFPNVSSYFQRLKNREAAQKSEIFNYPH